MKGNFKFLTIVVAVLLASTLLLTGCMYAIAATGGEAKQYDLDAMSDSAGENVGVNTNDAPTSQTELQKKFAAMVSIDKENNSITVITQEYLNEYWQSNYDREVIHSLTAEEVMFIVQDSIRIFFEYESIILPEFASVSSNMETALRFPLLKEQKFITYPTVSDWDQDVELKKIYDIIIYRIKALSSPKAFISASEAIIFAGGNPATYNGLYPESVFYIPGYSETTDRDKYLGFFGKHSENEDIGDYFAVNYFGAEKIVLKTAKGGSNDIYPTAELKSTEIITVQSDEGPWFALAKTKNRFHYGKDLIISSALFGIYEYRGDDLILKVYGSDFDPDNRYVFVMKSNGDGAYIYSERESVPHPELAKDIKDGMVFYVFRNTREDLFSPAVNLDTVSEDYMMTLRQRFPEYFGQNGMKGIEVYYWRVDGVWYYGLMTGTNRLKTPDELENLKQNGATLEEMRIILATYENAESYVSVISLDSVIGMFSDPGTSR